MKYLDAPRDATHVYHVFGWHQFYKKQNGEWMVFNQNKYKGKFWNYAILSGRFPKLKLLSKSIEEKLMEAF